MGDMFPPEIQTSLSRVRDMNNQLNILTAAVLMTAALCLTQAFATPSETTHSSATTIVATAGQNIQVADWDFDPTGSDESM
jgi:hypothetical protein